MPTALSALVLDTGTPLGWFLDVLFRVPSLALLLVFGVIAAAGPRPLADYIILVFAGLALINVLTRPVSMRTIGPAAAAAIAFFTLNSRIITVKIKYRIVAALAWLRTQLTRPPPPRRR